MNGRGGVKGNREMGCCGSSGGIYIKIRYVGYTSSTKSPTICQICKKKLS